jgi:molybdenum cofactor guanylyltransferase
MTAIAPLVGLVLSGGYSKRMQRDKATLLVDGETQLARAVRLCQSLCDAVFVSVRPDQTTEPTRAAHTQIVDQLTDVGPAAGILAAQAHSPHAAWLVLAVDLPLLDEVTLRHLVQARDPRKLATAYISEHDGLPEPLCAIWEPASHQPLLEFIVGGRHCPRKFLMNHPVHLVALPIASALSNINTPDEYAATVAPSRRGELL